MTVGTADAPVVPKGTPPPAPDYSSVYTEMIPELLASEMCGPNLRYMRFRSAYLPVYQECREFGRCHEKDFDMTKELGSGYFGTVYKARHSRTGKSVAIKLIRRSRNDPRRFRRVRNEECNQHRVDFYLIAKHYCTFLTDRHVAMAIEYVEGLPMTKVVRSEHRDKASIKLRESDRRRIVAQLIVAIRYLHQRGIVFNDIRTKNTMITPSKNVKLIDFGLSIYDPRKALQPDLSNPWLPPVPVEKGGMMMMDGNDYAANLSKLDLNPKALIDDWYDLGKLMYEMYAGHKYDATNKAHAHYIKYSLGMKCPEAMNGKACDLFTKLTDPRVDQRWGPREETVRMMERHAYFHEVDWPSIKKGQVY